MGKYYSEGLPPSQECTVCSKRLGRTILHPPPVGENCPTAQMDVEKMDKRGGIISGLVNLLTKTLCEVSEEEFNTLSQKIKDLLEEVKTKQN